MKKVVLFFSYVDHYRSALVMAVVILNVSFGFLYAYLINSTIHNAVVVDQGQRALAIQGAKVSELESDYMRLTNAITLDFAYSQGFSDASTKQSYIATKSLSSNLSFNAI